MAGSIFSKILSGEIPSHRVYEDDHVYAFLDINPIARGHTLLIPKEEAATLDALSEESAEAIGRALPRICRAVKEVTGEENYNVLQNNGRRAHQAVQHVHFHVIPKPSPDEGLGIGWPADDLEDEEGEQLARELREAVGA